MTLEADFLTSAADKLAENVDRIETCLVELPPQALWVRDSEHENAVGNLLLHLEGTFDSGFCPASEPGPTHVTAPASFRHGAAKTLRR